MDKANKIGMYVGKKVGYLRIVRYNEKNNTYYARCKCGRCLSMTNAQAKHGSVHACEKCIKFFPSHDLTGNQYGYMFVLYPKLYNGEFYNEWICRCSKCGKVANVLEKNLTDATGCACPNCGAGASLAALADEKFSLRNLVFGELTVIRPSYHESEDAWTCKCSCGSREEFTREELISGVCCDCGGEDHFMVPKKITYNKAIA